MLQCVAVCGSVLTCFRIVEMSWFVDLVSSVEVPHIQCVAVCDAVCFAVFCSVLQCVAVCCSVWQCVAVCGSVLQCVLQCVAVC